MKSNGHVSSNIMGHNKATLEAALKKAGMLPGDVGIAVLVADMFDEIHAGKNMYMILGSTQNRSAFSLTVKGEDAPAPLYAGSFLELGRLAIDLL